MKTSYILATAAVVALTAGMTAGAAWASPSRGGYQVRASAVTVLKDRPDSGDGGNNWADDSFTRTAVITRRGTAPDTDCGTTSGPCWLWAFTLRDRGTFTTIPGQQSPRAATLLDLAVTGSMKGGTTDGTFYATAGFPASSPPGFENDYGNDPAGDHTTGAWVEQFFVPSVAFGAVDLGADAGWSYRLDFGQDHQCPNDAYQWVDAAPDWGTGNANGNILAPDTADCT